MNFDNQSLIILFVGLSLLTSILLDKDIAIITGLSGILGGIYVGKRVLPSKDNNDKKGKDENNMTCGECSA